MAAAIVAARTGRKIAAQKRKARERWHESVAAHLREDVLDAFTSVDDDDDGSVTREELRALFSAVLPKVKKRLRAQDVRKRPLERRDDRLHRVGQRDRQAVQREAVEAALLPPPPVYF